MADILQQAMGGLFPKKDATVAATKFVMPRIDPLWACLIGIIVLFIFFMYIIWLLVFVYKIKILELEDRGRGGLVARKLHARTIMQNGVPKYQILGKRDEFGKPMTINASPSDNLIPLKLPIGIYRDILIMHRDKNGDYRPWKVITSPDQINLDDYIEEKNGQKMFKGTKFLDDIFPLLKIDNLKMRAWYNLKMKEVDADFKPKGEFFKQNKNVIFLVCMIIAIGLGVYWWVG